MYDFNKIIDRSGSGDLKHEVLEERYGRGDLLPLWVADMDFETPQFITDALRRRLDHSLFGYTVEPKEYWPTVQRWIRDHHQWEVPLEWFCYIPGIVKGIGMVINVFTNPDEKVIIQPPVYHPFRLTPEGNGREVVYNPLKENADGTYSMDFDNLAEVADEKCRLLILSNPHNPAGIVWGRETLARLADFCYDRGIIVISDEIHCDMALWGNKHVPFATASEKAAQCSITFGAPSKTFNIAGIVSSYSIVPNPEIRKKFYSWLAANELNEAPMFSPIATIAAFEQGEQWRRAMLAYVEDNIRYVEDYCREHLPMIRPLRPEASFLVWLDCRKLGLNHDRLIDLFVNKARLALNDGEMFGKGGEGFMRMNVATPRAILTQALSQLKDAVCG
ncbi:MAG: PatB family C-S lyase [Prevotella pectinovora]|uniref:MalY/PatB family protein n=1 Tax=Prevotella pectinovora TaxID=1602169 RepID=UPI0024314873|nr:PatB family C-S lyase [Prevotella pectinovora]MCI6048895.1 PatB family C-S lyase [Prevotella pectinovora]